MLPKQVLFISFVLLVAIIGSAQKSRTVETQKTTTSTTIDSKTIEQLPFSRNFNEFAIMQNFGYSNTKPGNSDNHTNNVNLNIDYNRFVADHVGIGVEFDLSSSKSTNGSAYSKNTNWMLYGNVIYGTTFNNNFNLYGKLSVGFGDNKSSTNMFTSPSENQFGYKFEIGSPIHLFDGGGNYITPFIGYNHFEQKNSGSKISDNEFNFGFRLQNYSPCEDYECDYHHGGILSRNAYGQGRSFIGYSSWGDFGFGKSKFEFNNNTTEENTSSGLLDFEYGYYFIPNLAIGAGINWNSSSQGSGNSKFTSSELLFMPMLTANVPSTKCWNNLFLQGGSGFGYQNNTSAGPNRIHDKEHISNYCLNIGYNDFFGKHLAFTPKLGYDWKTFKNTTTNTKIKYSGFEFGLGCSLHF